ncbi:THH1/TOM1/TOM3 domain-containing protein [Plasmodiophora brassicae]|uniref:Uncharacterized protein n=1 Tax=Plasmodiophora brassicae TaxID=37360 RepID=A0A0G4J082_PLABS|nr:hypothetical protein PBRA_001794 [Plasmodiophora brassicae]SPQ93780.1 unnamed protein product [Plasmodiophora brassicae]
MSTTSLTTPYTSTDLLNNYVRAIPLGFVLCLAMVVFNTRRIQTRWHWYASWIVVMAMIVIQNTAFIWDYFLLENCMLKNHIIYPSIMIMNASVWAFQLFLVYSLNKTSVADHFLIPGVALLFLYRLAVELVYVATNSSELAPNGVCRTVIIDAIGFWQKASDLLFDVCVAVAVIGRLYLEKKKNGQFTDRPTSKVIGYVMGNQEALVAISLVCQTVYMILLATLPSNMVGLLNAFTTLIPPLFMTAYLLALQVTREGQIEHLRTRPPVMVPAMVEVEPQLPYFMMSPTPRSV